MSFIKKIFSGTDWFLFLPYLILCGFGIVMVYSSSAGIGLSQGVNLASRYAGKQIIFVVVSLVLMFFISHIKFSVLRSYRLLLVVGGVLMLLLLYLRFVGKTINGAAGWISFGGISLQPAEICKFFFIIFFAKIFGNRQQKITDNGLFRATISNPLPFVIPGLMLFLILVQPDTGGFAINLFIILAMFAAACTSLKSILTFAGIVFFAPILFIKIFGGLIVHFVENSQSYQLQRFVSFYNPFLHAQSSGSQLINSFYAVSNGGFFGRGLGNSIQKMGYLAEPNTDFILPIIAEEFGFIGVAIVLGLLFVIIVRIIDVGFKTTNIYYSTICYGTAAYFTIQTLFNAGGSIGFVPLTGVALPFVSYGGSSLITLSLCLGVVIHISRVEKQNDYEKLN